MWLFIAPCKSAHSPVTAVLAGHGDALTARRRLSVAHDWRVVGSGRAEGSDVLKSRRGGVDSGLVGLHYGEGGGGCMSGL